MRRSRCPYHRAPGTRRPRRVPGRCRQEGCRRPPAGAAGGSGRPRPSPLPYSCPEHHPCHPQNLLMPLALSACCSSFCTFPYICSQLGSQMPPPLPQLPKALGWAGLMHTTAFFFFFFDTPVLIADAQALQPQDMGAPGSRRAVPPVPSCVASHQHRDWQAELNKYCFSGSSI